MDTSDKSSLVKWKGKYIEDDRSADGEWKFESSLSHAFRYV